jgi:hypothetical protein
MSDTGKAGRFLGLIGGLGPARLSTIIESWSLRMSDMDA